MMNFAYPYLWLLVLLPPIIYYLLPVIKGVHGDALRIPFLKDLLNIKNKSGSIWVDINNSKLNLSKILLIIIYIFVYRYLNSHKFGVLLGNFYKRFNNGDKTQIPFLTKTIRKEERLLSYSYKSCLSW